MKKLLIILIIFYFLPSLSNAQQFCNELLNLDWINNLGGSYTDNITDVKIDANQNIFITGYIDNAITYQSQIINQTNTLAFFLAKLSPSGNLIWIKTADLSTNVTDLSHFRIAIDTNNNNIYAIGNFYHSLTIDGTTIFSVGNNNVDIFILGFSNSGTLIFANRYGSPADDAAGGICIHNGDIVFNGTYTNTIQIAGNLISCHGGKDSFVAKVTPINNFVWCKRWASISDDYASDVVSDNQGNMYILGTFLGNLFNNSNFGNMLNTSSTPAAYMLKLDSFGDAVFPRQKALDAAYTNANRVFVDNNQNIYISYNGADGSKLAKYNSTGTNTMNLTLGTSCSVFDNNAIYVDNQGFIYLTGGFIGGCDFGDGDIVGNVSNKYCFVAKYSDTGAFVDKKIGASTVGASGLSICKHDNNSVLVAGKFNNTINITGGHQINSYGLEDGFLCKFSKSFYIQNITQTSIACDPNNINITLQVQGGQQPLSYLWSNSATTQNLTGVTVDQYSVTISDAAGCKLDTTFNVPTPSGPTINLPPTMSICFYDTVQLDAGNFASFLWSTGETTQKINVYNAGTYLVTITDVSSCQSTASVVVTKKPNINILADTAYLCINSFKNITLQGYQEILWYNGSTSQNLHVTTPGDYWVKVRSSNCYYYDTIKVIYSPKFQISLGPDVYFCSGSTVVLSVDLPCNSYFWSNGTTQSTYTVGSAGTFWCRATDSFGCESSDTIKVIVENKPIANLGNDTVSCGIGLILNPHNSVNSCHYLWNTGETLSAINVSVSGYYSVTITSEHNLCTASDGINVEIYPKLNIDIGNVRNICEGKSTTFSVPDNLHYVLWMTGETTHSISVSENTLVHVIVRDTNGCSAEANSEVIVHNISVSSLGNDTILCLGVTLELSPEGNYDYYKWNNGSSASSILVSYPGHYTLTVSDIYGCSASTGININYEDSPVITDINEVYGNITVIAEGGYLPYQYSIDNDQWQNENIFNNCKEGEHTVTVIDANKCPTSAEITVNQAYRVISFFTPNNDGFNDTWEIEGFFLFPNATATIFDRFGKQLYSFQGGDQGWNGTYQGKAVPSDTYWYVIDFGHGKPLKGPVTIKR